MHLNIEIGFTVEWGWSDTQDAEDSKVICATFCNMNQDWRSRACFSKKSPDPSDDESCVICFGEEGECDIYFSPCGHKACKACVQKLRIANVYKADKGVRCPICRQVIDGYLDTPPVESTCTESSPHTEISAKLENKQLYCRAGVTSIGNGNDYVPPRGVTGADGGGLRCNIRQDEPIPGYIVPPLRAADDVVAMAMDRMGARHLDFMLREGYPKRQKVAKICREMLTPYVSKLAIHGSGNYVLQRMLEYAAANRGEIANGEPFFTALVRSFCENKGLVLAAQDKRGTFSVQKMLVSLQGSEELSLVNNCICGSVVLLALHQHGVYVLERLVEILIVSLSSPASKKPRVPSTEAARVLANISNEMTSDISALSSITKHQVSSTVLVECIRWSLPLLKSFESALALASHSNELLGCRISHRTLQGILSLEVKKVADLVVSAMKGRYVELAFDQVSCGFKLVRACLATYSVTEELRVAIVDELLHAFSHSPAHITLINAQHVCDVLAFGLSVLSHRYFDERMKTLLHVLGPDKFSMFKHTIYTMRKLHHVENITQEASIVSDTRVPPDSAKSKRIFAEPNSMIHDTKVLADSGTCHNNSYNFPIVDPWTEGDADGGEVKQHTYITADLSKSINHGDRKTDYTLGGNHYDSSTLQSLPSRDSKPNLVAAENGHQGASQIPPSNWHEASVPIYKEKYHEQNSAPVSRICLSAHSREVGGGNIGPYDLRGPAVNNENKGIAHGTLETSLYNNPYGYHYGKSMQPFNGTVDSLPNADISNREAFSLPGRVSQHHNPKLCVMCKNAAANSVFLDCSHMCCCSTCASRILLCPVCNSPVKQVVQVRPFDNQVQQHDNVLKEDFPFDSFIPSRSVDKKAVDLPMNNTVSFSNTRSVSQSNFSSQFLPSDLYPSLTQNYETKTCISEFPSFVDSTLAISTGLEKLNISTVPSNDDGNNKFYSLCASNQAGPETYFPSSTLLQQRMPIKKPPPYRPLGVYRPPDVFARPAS